MRGLRVGVQARGASHVAFSASVASLPMAGEALDAGEDGLVLEDPASGFFERSG